MSTGLKNLQGKWKNCQDQFAKDARFSDFAKEAAGIQWLDTPGKLADRIVISDGRRYTREGFVGDAYSLVVQAANGTNTNQVVIGQLWYSELSETEKAANAIHEALHVLFKDWNTEGDAELKGWLANFGFKPGYKNNYGTHDITAWIADGCPRN